MSKMKLLAGGLLGLLAAFLPLSTAHAAGETMYLTPSSQVAHQNGALDVTARINSGSNAVNAIQVNLSYPSSQLEFTSATPSADYEITAQNVGGGGSVKVAVASFTPKTGDHLVVTVHFKVLASSGTATISFADGTEMDGGGGPVANTQTGTTVSFGGAASPSPTPSASPTSPSTASKSTSPDTTPPKIQKAQVVATADGTSIKWQTDEPCTAEVAYGPTAHFGFTAHDTNASTSHSVALDSKVVPKKTVYYYQITCTDIAGNKASSPATAFTTAGLLFSVKVVDSKGKPLVGAKVEFGGQSYTTNSQGSVQLSAGQGSQKVTVTNGKSKQTLTVDPGSDNANHKSLDYSVTLAVQRSSLTNIGLAVLAVLVVVVAALVVRRWLKNRRPPTPTLPTDLPTGPYGPYGPPGPPSPYGPAPPPPGVGPGGPYPPQPPQQ